MIFVTDVGALRSLLKDKALYSIEPVWIRIPEMDPSFAAKREARIARWKRVSAFRIAIRTVSVTLAVGALTYLHTDSFARTGWRGMPVWLMMVPPLAGCLSWQIARIGVNIFIRREIRLIIKHMSLLAEGYRQQCALD